MSNLSKAIKAMEERLKPTYEKRRFKLGQTVKLINNPYMCAQIGALAKVTGGDDDYLYIQWLNKETSCGQMDGGYDYQDFTPI